MAVIFGWKVLSINQSDIVVTIFLTLLGMTVVFGFGLWITCKRKFLLLKLYAIILLVFVAIQVIAVVLLATGSSNSDECVCYILDFGPILLSFWSHRRRAPVAPRSLAG
jgi:hypothetical protein